MILFFITISCLFFNSFMKTGVIISMDFRRNPEAGECLLSLFSVKKCKTAAFGVTFNVKS